MIYDDDDVFDFYLLYSISVHVTIPVMNWKLPGRELLILIWFEAPPHDLNWRMDCLQNFYTWYHPIMYLQI